jgi:hypothetical protein
MNHMEFAELESRSLGKNGWQIWAEKVEKILGHDLDGNQDTDGYSMDYAFAAWNNGLMPFEYVAQVKNTKAGAQ